jgi:hypothetical protein
MSEGVGEPRVRLERTNEVNLESTKKEPRPPESVPEDAVEF